MATLETIHAAIVTRLQGIDGLAVFDSPPMHATPPVAILLPPAITYHRTFGSDDVKLHAAETEVWLATASTAWSDAAVEAAWPYMDATGTQSFVDTLYGSDKTLGGVVEGLVVRSVRPLQDEIGGVTYFGAAFTIEFNWRPG